MSLTDPDSRAMAAHTKVAVGYNVQLAIDAKHKLIVEQAVSNQVVDKRLKLTQTVEPARAILEVETTDVAADRGYFQERGHRGLREGRLRSLMFRSLSAAPRCATASSARTSSA